MTEATLFPLLSGSAASLERYLSAISTIPTLTPEREQELAHRLQQHDDTQAAQQLVLSHLRFVAHIARGYTGYGLPMQDIIQEGNIGLMKAVKRFDPSTGFRLSSFAVHWVKSEIHEFVLRNWAIVRLATTKAQRKLFFNVRKATKKGQWFSPDEAQALAEKLDVSASDVIKMELRMASRDLSYDVDNEEDDAHFQSTMHMIDHDSDVAERVAENEHIQFRNKALNAVFADLSERNRAIIQARILDDNKATLLELADKYGVSHERIRQLEKQALTKMADALNNTPNFTMH